MRMAKQSTCLGFVNLDTVKHPLSRVAKALLPNRYSELWSSSGKSRRRLRALEIIWEIKELLESSEDHPGNQATSWAPQIIWEFKQLLESSEDHLRNQSTEDNLGNQATTWEIWRSSGKSNSYLRALKIIWEIEQVLESSGDHLRNQSTEDHLGNRATPGVPPVTLSLSLSLSLSLLRALKIIWQVKQLLESSEDHLGNHGATWELWRSSEKSRSQLRALKLIWEITQLFERSARLKIDVYKNRSLHWGMKPDKTIKHLNKKKEHINNYLIQKISQTCDQTCGPHPIKLWFLHTTNVILTNSKRAQTCLNVRPHNCWKSTVNITTNPIWQIPKRAISYSMASILFDSVWFTGL